MTTTEKEYVLKQIDDAIRYVWMNDIASDYENRWLLKEDTLKNAMYHYLRMKLSNLLEKYDLRIFTEFTDDKFQGTGYRPDIVIARMDFEKSCNYWGEAVTECLCILELKYKNGSASPNIIYSDYKKIQHYCEILHVKCPMYMATIWEHEDDETSWLSDDDIWAKNRVTELNASYKCGTDTMHFSVCKH